MIQVDHLSKAFKLSKKQRKELGSTESTIKAVDTVSFQCQPGRIFSLLGPNGAGKTTTLRMIATLLKPTEGNITVNGHSVLDAPQKVRASIGFLTGSTGLYHRLTPTEIIRYFGKLYDMPPQKLEERRNYLFDLLDIHPFANKRIGQLSTGMKQKVSIARTMIHDPEVVVFDEPTSGLDVITAENIINLIRDCKTAGKTVIFSSHIMTEVDLLSDDLAIIHKGSLLYNAPMKTFREEMKAYTLTEAFIRLIKDAEAAA